MAHILHRFTRRLETSMKQRRASRRLNAVLRDPHLAKDIGLPPARRVSRKPDLW